MDLTFNRPLGTVPGDKELEDFVRVATDGAIATRQVPETKWNIASAVLDGHHYYNVDWYSRQVTVDAHNPKGSVRVRVPETLQRYRREKGRLQSVLRVPSSRPVVQNDPDLWRLNRFAQGGLAYIYHKGRFPEVYDSLLSDLLVEGTVGIMPYWDEGFLLDPQTGSADGEVKFRIIPAWELYPFPSGAVDDLSCSGMIWGRVVGEEWVRQNIPEALKEKSIKVMSPWTSYGQNQLSNPTTMEGFQVRYVFFEPSRRFPLGEMALMVGDHVYRRAGALNFWLGEDRVVPISVARYTKKPTSWWGESFIYEVAKLNKELNRAMTLQVRRAVLKAHPGYLMVPQGSVPSLEDFKNQVGGVVQYRQPVANTDFRPYILSPQSSSPDNDILIQRLSGFTEDLTSQHGPTAGETVGRVEGNSALQSLIRQDMIPNEGTIQSLDRCVKRAFGIALEIGRNRWSKNRKATISGPVGGPPTTIIVNPKEIPSLDKIEILTGLDMPMDRPTLIQFLSNLALTPNATGQTLLSPEEFRRGLIALGVVLPGVDLMSPDEEAAWVENFTIYGDGMTPGNVYPPDSALEDSSIHLRVHKRFFATPEFQASSPAVRAAASQHIQATVEAMSGSMAPASFDQDFVGQTSEDMIDEIQFSPQFQGE